MTTQLNSTQLNSKNYSDLSHGSVSRVIVWINGTHGSGKTTTSRIVQTLLPDSRVFDAEKIGEALMDITPGLPATDNFQHWPPWRALVVETARQVLDYTEGTLVMPMTVLVEAYWREISSGLAHYAIPLRHWLSRLPLVQKQAA